MASHDDPPISEDALHALTDGRLSAAQAEALRARLARDAETQATAAAWQAQRVQLQALHAAWDAAPVPDSLRRAAGRLEAVRERAARWWRLGGMAASLLLAFGLGWTVHGQWPTDHRGQAAGRMADAAPAVARRFAQQAAVAHAVYQPEQRHPVEVAAAQQEHLVQWLSKRLGRPLRIPVLAAQGYELVGGRLLPGDTGARAQFMYQNAAGERVTLYLGALAAGQPGAADTAFRFDADGPVPCFYWTDGGFGYALSGALPRAALLGLATAVHPQL